MKFIWLASVAIASFCSTGSVSGAALVSGLRDVEVQSLIRDRIVSDKQNVGIVVGVIDKNGSRIFSHGALERTGAGPVDGDTVFEIGSVTKLFTSLVLADMVERGEVSLADPVLRFLPKEVNVPSRGGREITLEDLARHRSGLPREADNLMQKNRDYNESQAAYSVDKLYTFLSGYQLTHDIGSETAYSNVGVGLLGHALARHTNTDYESLVRSRVTDPLGMLSTAVVASPAMLARRATGHQQDGSPARFFGNPWIASAGALQSSVKDMMKFLAASMHVEATPLGRAMQRMQHPGKNKAEEPLAWGVGKKYDSEIWSHNGGTTGFSSYLAFDKVSGRGVVVLSNSAIPVDDIGSKILNRRFRLRQYAPPPNFAAALAASGYADVNSRYDKFSKDPDFWLDEVVLNEWAYSLLAKNQVDPAIDLFKLAVRIRPKSGNAHDSLGDGYERKGLIMLALESYRKSLEYTPTNANATERIRILSIPMLPR